jgi:hypothetical protein
LPSRGVPVAARLVQDFGGPGGTPPNDPVTVDPERRENSPPIAAAKRRRGRPPGSRTKKPA